MPRPGLMLGAWRKVGYDHFHSLQLLILGWNGAHLIGDLITFHWNVLSLHIGDMQEDVGATVRGGDEAVALGPAEALADALVDRALGSPHRRRKRPGPACGQGAGNHIVPQRGWGALCVPRGVQQPP